MQRAAKLLSNSTLVPDSYRAQIEKTDRYGNVTDTRENPNALSNCVVALNMAQRMNADPLMVMQNLFLIEGRPSWSSQWIIAAINGCGRFSPLRFDLKKTGKKKVECITFEWRTGENGKRERQKKTQEVEIEDIQCIAWALERGSETRLESPPVSVSLAVQEGWYTKNGSKWQTMPEVMLRYRTASFFGKLYAPELLMGLQTVEEMQDVVIDAQPDGHGGYVVDVESLKAQAAPKTAQEGTASDTLKPDAGEILDQKQNADLRHVEQQKEQETAGDAEIAADTQAGDNAPAFFTDAVAAVKSGDFDLAADLARSLPEGQRKQIEASIANTRKPEPRQRRERGALNLE
jgi:hypothetical protein